MEKPASLLAAFKLLRGDGPKTARTNHAWRPFGTELLGLAQKHTRAVLTALPGNSLGLEVFPGDALFINKAQM